MQIAVKYSESHLEQNFEFKHAQFTGCEFEPVLTAVNST